MRILNITPVPKPRMTQRDKWANRPCVARYHDFKDLIRASQITIPSSGCIVTFILPMPKSWSKKKREAVNGAPHKAKPDIDNLLKALLDSVFNDDAHIYDIRAIKKWGENGQIVIEHSNDPRSQPAR